MSQARRCGQTGRTEQASHLRQAAGRAGQAGDARKEGLQVRPPSREQSGHPPRELVPKLFQAVERVCDELPHFSEDALDDVRHIRNDVRNGGRDQLRQFGKQFEELSRVDQRFHDQVGKRAAHYGHRARAKRRLEGGR
ncbi:Uncharacterised protein [Mycobacterium tuberculosis]|nr:Uncharacterised protein [Mycobacterium tuberculosis]